MKGKIKFFKQTEGFGFITGEDGKDYFVHSSALEPGVSVKAEDPVTFEIEHGAKGPRASKVLRA